MTIHQSMIGRRVGHGATKGLLVSWGPTYSQLRSQRRDFVNQAEHREARSRQRRSLSLPLVSHHCVFVCPTHGYTCCACLPAYYRHAGAEQGTFFQCSFLFQQNLTQRSPCCVCVFTARDTNPINLHASSLQGRLTKLAGKSKCCQIKTRQTESLLWARNLCDQEVIRQGGQWKTIDQDINWNNPVAPLSSFLKLTATLNSFHSDDGGSDYQIQNERIRHKYQVI